MSGPTVSVVIPAFNEEAMIGQCLESLVRQVNAPAFEVIVVNNRSTDNTEPIAVSFTDRLDLKVISEERQGRGAARAKGFNQAKGGILFSTDADATLPADWIARMTQALSESPGAVAVTGPARIEDCGRMRSFFLTALFPFYMRLGILFGFGCLNGFNFAVRKEVYEKSGGFDPVADAQEDMDLTVRVRKLGSILYESRAVVISGRRFKQGIFQAWYEYGSSYFLRFVCGRRRVLLRNVK